MAQHKLREDDPMPVAKACGAASLILGVGVPVSAAALLALSGWALDPLVGPSAREPFLTFVADSYTPVGLAWMGLGVVTLLLFVTALLEVKESGEASPSTLESLRWVLLRGSRRALACIVIAPLHLAGCPPLGPNRRISSVTLISAVLTTLVASVGVTSTARRLQ